MSNLYVFRDFVSGNTGDVFQFPNDGTMRRSCIRSLASVPPEIARDTVVLNVGTIDFDLDNVPIVRPCEPRIALVGSAPEVDSFRSQLMAEASSYRFNDGGTADET